MWFESLLVFILFNNKKKKRPNISGIRVVNRPDSVITDLAVPMHIAAAHTANIYAVYCNMAGPNK